MVFGSRKHTAVLLYPTERAIAEQNEFHASNWDFLEYLFCNINDLIASQIATTNDFMTKSTIKRTTANSSANFSEKKFSFEQGCIK